MGIVVYNPQALKSHFLPFISQEGPKLEIYDTIPLHIWPTCLHRWNYPFNLYWTWNVPLIFIIIELPHLQFFSLDLIRFMLRIFLFANGK